MYLFYPVGGLANRMRVINSAVQLCTELNKSYRIYWLKDTGLNCSFNTIWKPIKHLFDSDSRLLFLLFKFKRKSGFFRAILKIAEKLRVLKVFSSEEYNELFKTMKEPEKLNRYLFCIISSFSSFYIKDKFNGSLFDLQPEIIKLVDSETEKFDKHTIGVHIRRTDNIDSIQKSPLELFINKMKGELQKEPTTNFYIASDSQEVKIELNEIFGDRVKLPSGELSRNSETGIIQAVLELYALSRTNKVYGSFYSSFSQAAAELGNIEYEVIKIDIKQHV